MRKKWKVLPCLLLSLFVTACADNGSYAGAVSEQESAEPESSDNSQLEEQDTLTENEIAEEEGEDGMQQMFCIEVNGEQFTAEFEDNSGARALKELLEEGDLTIRMNDYGGFEKVGSVGQSLPTENSQTVTEPGDIVLYQGNQIVIFYGSNAWSYTRLGRIDNLDGWQEALGSGDVTAVFSLPAESSSDAGE